MALDDELARLSLHSRPRSILHKRPWTERRDIMIEQRIKALERSRKHLPPEKKWPTAKSVRLHQEAKLKPGPVVSITETTPHKAMGKPPATRPRPDYLAELLAPSTSPRSEFPFPVTDNKRGPSFICFSSLPTELRLQIWEDALVSEVKFIEVQYSSQFYGSTFFHSFPQTSLLCSVCRESRALVLSLKNTPRSPPFCRLLLHRSQDDGDKRGQSLRFNPERDTIFLRSLDQPFGIGGLLELSHRVSKIQRIQHLAVPLSPAYLPPNNEWKRAMANLRDLKTLTYVVGDMNQWVGCKYAELRDVEEWFRDGRERRFECDSLCLDVKDLGQYLSGARYEKRLKASYGWWSADEWKGINVRVVAWKRVVS